MADNTTDKIEISQQQTRNWILVGVVAFLMLLVQGLYTFAINSTGTELRETNRSLVELLSTVKVHQAQLDYQRSEIAELKQARKDAEATHKLLDTRLNSVEQRASPTINNSYSIFCMRAFLHDRNPQHLTPLQRLYGWVLKHNELHLAALLMLLWYPIQLAFAWYFPDAAPLSSTQLHKVLLTAVVFAFAHGFLWLGLRFNLPIIPRWLKKRFTKTFLSLTEWQKMQFFAFLWSAYLLCFAIMWHGASQAA